VAANAFARIAWPAFAVVVVTGMWNILDIKVGDMSTEYQITMFVHVLLAMAAAMFVVIHSIGQTKLALALGGALGLLTSLGAMFVGILLQTGR
jgi:thiosulfate reductase cytochrome b subunit